MMKPVRSWNISSQLISRASLAVVVFACALGPNTAHATSDLDRVSGYTALMSNYVGRGLSQSVGQPSVQFEANYYASSGWFTGVDVTTVNWVDKVYPGSSVHFEIDAYAGYRWIRGDWTLRSYAMRVAFPGDYAAQTPPAKDPDTNELMASVAWRGLSAKLNYAISDSYGTPNSKGSFYLDLAAGHALGDKWYLGAHAARKQSRGRDPVTGIAHARTSYNAYKVGLTRAFQHGVSVSVEQSWTTAETALYTLDGYHVAGPHLALIVLKNF